ncbi:hypothetical protein RB213_003634, partial [Colletotrichum asianum]
MNIIFSIEALHRLRLDLVPSGDGSRILLINIQPDRRPARSGGTSRNLRPGRRTTAVASGGLRFQNQG